MYYLFLSGMSFWCMPVFVSLKTFPPRDSRRCCYVAFAFVYACSEVTGTVVGVKIGTSLERSESLVWKVCLSRYFIFLVFHECPFGILYSMIEVPYIKYVD